VLYPPGSVSFSSAFGGKPRSAYGKYSPSKRRVTIPPPVAMLLELLVAHTIDPESALKLIGVNVANAEWQAKAEQVNKAPRFFQSLGKNP
jgi:hypothetical protein